MVEKVWAKKIVKIGREEVVYFNDMTDRGGTSTMYSPEWNEGLEKYRKYIDEKYCGDFSELFLSDFADKIPPEDKITIRDEI